MLEIRWRNGGLRVPDWCIINIKTGTNTSVINGGHTTTVKWNNLKVK